MRIKLNPQEIDFSNKYVECHLEDMVVKIPIRKYSNLTPNTVDSTITNGARSNAEIFNWSANSTKLFISFYKEASQAVSARKIKNKVKMWEVIAEKMTEHNYKITALQAQNKFKSLMRTYKNVMANNKKTGRDRMTFEFEK